MRGFVVCECHCSRSVVFFLPEKFGFKQNIITPWLSFVQNTVYVTIGDASKENPLLDSRFPDVSGKGRGYQVQAYPQGSDVWPALRKVSVWQTVGALEKVSVRFAIDSVFLLNF